MDFRHISNIIHEDNTLRDIVPSVFILAFEGDEPNIALKGQGQELNSPLRKQLVGSPDYSKKPKLTPREPLMRLVSTEAQP